MTQCDDRVPDVCISEVGTSGLPDIRISRFRYSRSRNALSTNPLPGNESDFLIAHDCATRQLGSSRTRDAANA